MKAALGSEPASVLSQMLAHHKLAQTKMNDYHSHVGRRDRIDTSAQSTVLHAPCP